MQTVTQGIVFDGSHVLLIRRVSEDDKEVKDVPESSVWGFLVLPSVPEKETDMWMMLSATEKEVERVSPKSRDQMTFLGSRVYPHWGYQQARPYEIAFYLIYGETAREMRSQPLPPDDSWRWLTPTEALHQWQRAELWLSPFTVQHLDALIQTKGDIDTLQAVADAQARCSTPGLQTPLCFGYSPLIQCIPIRSATLPPFQCTNLVVIGSATSNELAIVDPGANQQGRAHFEELMKHWGTRVTHVLITHHHHDHVEALQTVELYAPHAKLVGHSRTISRMHNAKLRPFPLDHNETVIVGGTTHIRSLVTFGHTDGHLCFFHEQSRTLIAGDHIVGVGSAVLDMECGDMKDYFESTKHLISLHPRVALPAHGPPNFAATALLESYLKHRQAREDAILAVVQSTGKTRAEDIVSEVYKDVPPHMHKIAQSNVELHLKKLKRESKF